MLAASETLYFQKKMKNEWERDHGPCSTLLLETLSSSQAAQIIARPVMILYGSVA